VSIDDNFFDLGGHSLLLVQLHPHVQKLAARDVSVVELFRYPSIRSLARFLGDADSATPTQDDFAERARRQRARMRTRPKREGEER
jgi:hypothetical protein